MDTSRLSAAGRVTVREVLDLPSVAIGAPSVLAGRDSLDRSVHWVHICEQPDVTEFIDGGELILTSGTGVPPDPDAWAELGRSINRRGAAGLLVELGAHHRHVPETLIEEADAAGLPVISLSRSIRFVDVTRTVHERLLDGSNERLRHRIDAQQTFTNLTLRGADPDVIVDKAAALIGSPVVLEDVAHRVLACAAAGRPLAQLLRGWEQRSRDITARSPFDYDADQRWLTAQVGEPDRVWGRLVLVLDGPEAAPHARVIAELAVNALALRRLIDGNRESVTQQARRTLLTELLSSATHDEEALAGRARGLGVDLSGGKVTVLAVRVHERPDGASLAERRGTMEHVDAVRRALRHVSVPGLVADDATGVTAVAVALDPARADALVRLCEAVHREVGALPGRYAATIGVGTEVRGIGEIRRSYLQAHDASAAATLADDDGDRLYYTVADTHLHGLLHPLRDDPRLQAYVERELGPLLRHDDRHGTDLVHVLRTVLAHRGNKSTAATALAISRPSLYERLRRIQRILGVDIDRHDVALSLDVALCSLDGIRNDGSRRPDSL